MRYYFHIKGTDIHILDEEGMEFSDLDAALEEAVRAAGEIAREVISEAGSLALGWIEVVDEAGESLFTVPIRNAHLH